MKPLLHLKTALLLVYVALCTHMVLSALEVDAAAAPALPVAVGG